LVNVCARPVGATREIGDHHGANATRAMVIADRQAMDKFLLMVILSCV
jgi:hypothetical protein